jgi:phenylacetate-CoA ligase
MYGNGFGRASDDEVHALQEERALARVTDAWSVPFYRGLWTAAGVEPGDITSLDDLDTLPTFDSDDLQQALAEAPPFGSHHPFGRDDMAGYLPLKLQTSGGTTGMPRTTMFDAVAWEVQGIQTARALWAQGGRPGDVIQIPFTNALGNAAWSAYVGIHHWLGAVPVTTGSGAVTASARQLELAASYGTDGWYAMGDYLARLTDVAEEIGFDLRSLPTRYLLSFLGSDTDGHLRSRLEAAWGAPVFDNYGAHEIGLVAFECAHQAGRHVNEDTVHLQVVDVDDPNRAVPRGRPGNLVATSLHRQVPPIIRYNLRDTIILSDRSRCACGLTTARLSTFLGRSDEMVKARGQNVYPMACQDAVAGDGRTTGQFLCVVRRLDSGRARREEMRIQVERRSRDVDEGALRSDLQAELAEDLGVRVDVDIVEAGDLARHTGLGGEGKVRRLLDLRDGRHPRGGAPA